MKKVSKSLMTGLVGLSLVAGLSGCGTDNSDLADYFGGGSSGGSDSLQIIKKEAGNFDIKWNKGSSGYSSVKIRSKGNTRGTLLMGDNYSHSYTMECTVSDMTTEYVKYHCVNLDVETGSTRRSKSFRMIQAHDYEIFASSNSQQVAKTLRYDGTIQQVSFK